MWDRICVMGSGSVRKAMNVRGARQVGPREEVEDLVGAAANEVESVKGKGGPCTVADETLESGAVGGLDADAGVEAEPTAVIPGQRILGVVGLQEAVAAEMPQDPGADGVLEALRQLVGEGGGFVEAEAGFRMGRVLIRVILDPMEEPVHDAEVIVEVGIEGGAETVEETHGPERGIRRCRGTGFPQVGPKGPEQDVKDGAGGPGPVVEEGAQTLGAGEHPTAHGHVREDVVHQVSRRLGHAFGIA